MQKNKHMPIKLHTYVYTCTYTLFISIYIPKTKIIKIKTKAVIKKTKINKRRKKPIDIRKEKNK